MEQAASPLEIEVVGSGERVVLVHGSDSGRASWRHQRPLAERYELVLASRRGYDGSPRGGRYSFRTDAADIAPLLAGGVHLAGFSYGALGCLLVAAGRPHDVRSLTVIEPPAFGLVAERPAVCQLVAELDALYPPAAALAADEFGPRFARLALGLDRPDEPLSDAERAGIETLMREEPAWHADVPLDALARAGVPTLVVSGGWSEAFEAVCDLLAAELGAERAVFPGHGHAVRRAGAALNARLDAFWRASAERRRNVG